MCVHICVCVCVRVRAFVYVWGGARVCVFTKHSGLKTNENRLTKRNIYVFD